MIDNIKKHIIYNKQTYIIGCFLFMYAIALSWYSSNDISLWWDQSVYIGMGKYIASGGDFGMWEMFRPPLLPLIYALLFKLHISLIIAGKVIVILSSIGSVFIVYLISESIKKGSGVFASLFLAITPVFFLFSRVPMTDVMSVFFVLLALFLYSNNKYFLTGIVIGLSFLLRFPQGLILFSIAIIILYETHNNRFISWMKESFMRGFFVLLGFLIIVTPYFISNLFLYGDFLKPIISGSGVISLNDMSNYLYDHGLFFYVKEIWFKSPFLYFSTLIPFIFYQRDFFTKIKYKKNLINVIIVAVIFMLYFFWQPHKELRYSIAFIPYLAILSGVSFYLIIKWIKRDKIIIALFSVFLIFWVFKSIPYMKGDNNDVYIPLNKYMEKLSGTYISITPVPVALSNIYIIKIFDKASVFHDAFNDNQNSLDGIILNDCEIFCPEKSKTDVCEKDLNDIHSEINRSYYKKTFELKINKCTFNIYKK